jgi:hypothetical protein
MKRKITAAAFLTFVAAVGYAKPKIEDCVNFAPTWEAAVEEAKLLNVPIVVHNHGFN